MICCISVLYFSACGIFVFYFPACGILCHIFPHVGFLCEMFPRVEFCVIYFSVWNLVLYISAYGIPCCNFLCVKFCVIFFSVWSLVLYFPRVEFSVVFSTYGIFLLILNVYFHLVLYLPCLPFFSQFFLRLGCLSCYTFCVRYFCVIMLYFSKDWNRLITGKRKLKNNANKNRTTFKHVPLFRIHCSWLMVP